jgi:DNA-binding NarL/FixJ family response regulator
VIRVLVSAASAAVGAELKALICASPGLEALRGAADLAALAREVDRIRPDAVLLTLGAAVGEDEIASLLGAAAPYRLDHPVPRASEVPRREGTGKSRTDGLTYGEGPGFPAVVILAENARETSSALKLLRLGAHAVLPLDSTPEVIVAAVRVAAAGLIVVDADALDFPLPGEASAEPLAPELWPRPSTPVLTRRETEVLRMIAEGLGNKQIAWQLKVSEHTVKFHISSIFNKLGVSSRTEAVTAGIRRGLILV